MIGAKKVQKMRILDRVSYIHYLVQFRKDKSKDILALLDSRSKVNATTPAYAAELGLKMQRTNVSTQKIDRCLLETYSMIITAFQVLNKLGFSRFFQATFLLADISMKVNPHMPFLILSNVDV